MTGLGEFNVTVFCAHRTLQLCPNHAYQQFPAKAETMYNLRTNAGLILMHWSVESNEQQSTLMFHKHF